MNLLASFLVVIIFFSRDIVGVENFGHFISLNADATTMVVASSDGPYVITEAEESTEWFLETILPSTTLDGRIGDGFIVSGNIVFEKDANEEWIEVATLAHTPESVGGSVAVYGDFLYEQGNGRVFTYIASRGWNNSTILGNGSHEGADFGYSVATDGERMVVGAPDADLDYTDDGEALVYTKKDDLGGWSRTGWLGGNYREYRENAAFGSSVHVGGSTIVVRDRTGDTFIYGKKGERKTDKVDHGPVAVEDDTVVFGQKSKGEAHIYTEGYNGANFGLSTILTVEKGVEYEFGSSVSIKNNILAVGAPKAENGGAVYLYKVKGSKKPTLLSVLSPLKLNTKPKCPDDPKFRFKNSKKKDCTWAAKKTKNCKKKWGGARVRDFCPTACGVQPEACCYNDGDFLYENKKSQTCAWAGKKKKCDLPVGDSGDVVSDVCPVSCDTCPSAE